MAHYTFRFREGSRSSDVDVDFPDDEMAWDEAVAVCSDMIRKRLGDSPEWRLEVADKSGTVRHLFRLTAESFDPRGRLSWRPLSLSNQARNVACWHFCMDRLRFARELVRG
jgi:hypothetical protein